MLCSAVVAAGPLTLVSIAQPSACAASSLSLVAGPCCFAQLCHQAKRKRARMGDLKIVVAGCVAQQEGEQLLRRVPEVDLVMGECMGAQGQSVDRGCGRVSAKRQQQLKPSRRAPALDRLLAVPGRRQPVSTYRCVTRDSSSCGSLQHHQAWVGGLSCCIK